MGGFDRLDEVAVKPRLLRAAFVLFLAPPGQGDDAHASFPTAARGCGGRRRSRSAWACRCPSGSTSGRNAAAISIPSSPSWAVRTSWPIIVSIIDKLLRGIAVVVDDQNPPAGAGRRGGSPTRPAARAPPAARPAAAGREFASPPDARRCGPRRCRRASRPAASRSPAPRPSPPRDFSSVRSNCVNMSKTCGSIAAGMPTPLSLTADDRPVAFLPHGEADAGPPGSLYLTALLKRLREHLRNRVLSASTSNGRSGSVTDQPCRCSFDQTGAASTEAFTASARLNALAAEFASCPG